MSTFEERIKRIKRAKQSIGKNSKRAALVAALTAASMSAATNTAAQTPQDKKVYNANTRQFEPEKPVQPNGTRTYDMSQHVQQGDPLEKFYQSLPQYAKDMIADRGYELAPIEYQKGLNRSDVLYSCMVYSQTRAGTLMAIPMAEGYYANSSTKATIINPRDGISMSAAATQSSNQQGPYRRNTRIRKFTNTLYTPIQRALDTTNNENKKVNEALNASRRTRQTIERTQREVKQWQKMGEKIFKSH